MSHAPSRRAMDLLDRAGIDIASVPRTVPLERLQETAAAMSSDLLGEDVTFDTEDLASLVLRSLFEGRAWREARALALEHPDLAPSILRGTLPKVLESIENGLGGLDWGELPEDARQRAEEALDALLSGRSSEEIELTGEQHEALLLVLRMFIRAMDRKVAPLLDRLRQDADVILRLEELLPGQGWDLHRVRLRRTFLGNLERYSTIMRRHGDVDRLRELLGRMEGERERRSYSIEQATSETHSLRFSGDVQRVLPQEIVNLGDERLKLLFYSRMCERRLLTYQLRGRAQMAGERRRGGPVVALIDCSGSMSGEGELAAKALVLALGKRMIEEGREMRATLFSVETETYDLTGPEGASRFLDLLCHTFGGGTDFDAALREGVRSLGEPEWKGADVLFITDGLARIRDRGCLHDWNLLKERQGCRIFTVIVGGPDAGGLARVSDRVFLLSRRGEWSGGSLLKELTAQSPSGSCWVTQ